MLNALSLSKSKTYKFKLAQFRGETKVFLPIIIRLNSQSFIQFSSSLYIFSWIPPHMRYLFIVHLRTRYIHIFFGICSIHFVFIHTDTKMTSAFFSWLIQQPLKIYTRIVLYFRRPQQTIEAYLRLINLFSDVVTVL